MYNTIKALFIINYYEALIIIYSIIITFNKHEMIK